jgi:hypothetical protein
MISLISIAYYNKCFNDYMYLTVIVSVPLVIAGMFFDYVNEKFSTYVICVANIIWIYGTMYMYWIYG